LGPSLLTIQIIRRDARGIYLRRTQNCAADSHEFPPRYWALIAPGFDTKVTAASIILPLMHSDPDSIWDWHIRPKLLPSTRTKPFFAGGLGKTDIDLACMFHEGGCVSHVFAKRINLPERFLGVALQFIRFY
jgi:hypothetical protein